MPNPLTLKLSVATRFNAADEAVLDRLIGPSFHVARKTDLIQEGDAPGDVHLVLEGLACRYKILSNGRRQILALLLPGDFCDLHVALLREMDHSIATLSPCTMVRIPAGTVDELMHEEPRITRALWWATLVDESIMRESIAGLGQRETDRQMAHLFCELHLRLRTVGLVRNDVLDLPLTQEELGDLLGVSVVHTNHTLMKLRARGLADFQKGQVTILDRAGLRAFAGFRANYLHLSGIDDPSEPPARGGRSIMLDIDARTGRTTRAAGTSPPVSAYREKNVRNVRAMFTNSDLELADRHVLIVEDEYFAAQELTAAVRSAGGRVVGPVASAEDALALIARGEAVDAAILDINLGGSKVFPVAHALRRHGIPIVFVTGYDDWVVPQDYEDVPIFRKPADADNVVRLLFEKR